MAREEMRKREDEVLTAFCRALAIIDGEPATIIDRPDRRLPGAGGCEAILERRGRQWAVEHTTFDSFPGQRLDDARLRAVLDPAMQSIAAAFPGWRITVGVPIGAVPTGVPWPSVTTAFADGVIESLQSLPETRLNALLDLPGLFSVRVFRRRPHPFPGCFLVRGLSEDDLGTRGQVIVRALEKKREQLRPYVEQGLPAALLLDNDDIGSMEPHSAAEDFRRVAVAANLSGVDEMYLVDSTMRPPWFFPLKLGERIHPLPEFEDFFKKQYLLAYWSG